MGVTVKKFDFINWIDNVNWPPKRVTKKRNFLNVSPSLEKVTIPPLQTNYLVGDKHEKWVSDVRMDFQVSMVMEAGQSPLKRLLGLLHRELLLYYS